MSAPGTRTARARVLARATAAWREGRPHAALEILTDAGMVDHWPAFQAACLRAARRRFHREISRYLGH